MNASAAAADENIYEAEQILSEYLLFHYGDPDELLPWSFGPREAVDFPERCVRETLPLDELPADARALDLGCAVGRSTFALARHCHEVIGIDYSARFIAAAAQLADEGELPYRYRETGDVWKEAVARVPAGIDRGRVNFETGDAHDLRDHLGAFDVVLACNLLCRLHTPQQLLDRLPGLVKPGGWLVFTTPQTWLEDFTPKANWLGATPGTGTTLEALDRHLDKDFARERAFDMPFLIREHRRKFQWSVAEASVWRRR